MLPGQRIGLGGKVMTGTVGAGPGLWASQRGLAGQWPSRVKPLLSSPKPHSFLPASQFHLLQEAFPDCPPLDLAMLNLRSGEQFPEQELGVGEAQKAVWETGSREESSWV